LIINIKTYRKSARTTKGKAKAAEDDEEEEDEEEEEKPAAKDEEVPSLLVLECGLTTIYVGS
jgi:hypothetical protein